MSPEVLVDDVTWEFREPAPPGWYVEPTGDSLRWWDGHAWSDHVAARPAVRAGRRAHARSAGSGRHASSPSRTQLPELRRLAEGLVTVVLVLVTVMTVLVLRHQSSSSAVGDPTARPDGGSASSGDAGAPPSGPSAPSTGKVALLAQQSSTGDGDILAFTTSGPWQVQYSYDCGNVGSASPFVITSGGTTLVRTRGRSGSDLVTATTTGRHTLAVATKCGWVVRVFGQVG